MNYSNIALSDSKEWAGVVVHCSGSDVPEDHNVPAIHFLHTSPPTRHISWGEYSTFGKGWDDIGYHYIILPSGQVFEGRPLSEDGAHALGYNSTHIGICVCGNQAFTEQQKISLKDLCDSIKRKIPTVKEIIPHSKVNKMKTCPNFNLKEWLDGTR